MDAGVHPRLRGGASISSVCLPAVQGPSPPTRGSPCRCGARPTCERSIPAYAGEPAAETPPPGVPRVHPRLRGGAEAAALISGTPKGPSPPTRGSRWHWPCPSRGTGSIPAYAGEPIGRMNTHATATVHPRLRGGACTLRACALHPEGPSPPTRGSPKRSRGERAGAGSIPAYAGEPLACCSRSSALWVHPRLRGGALDRNDDPRKRNGPSPPTRGSRSVLARHWPDAGSIPAYAGEPGGISGTGFSERVHPRLRGGAMSWSVSCSRAWGPSPPTRGSLPVRVVDSAADGSIPAYAGEPAARGARRRRCWVHPRLRGGAADRVMEFRKSMGPSPPTRGSLRPREIRGQGGGSIPAYAGEPMPVGWMAPARSVHPRLRGGADSDLHGKGAARGPSPPTRGSPTSPSPAHAPTGSIPAYAGEPSTTTRSPRAPRVHPRLRGGAVYCTPPGSTFSGPSPPTPRH